MPLPRKRVTPRVLKLTIPEHMHGPDVLRLQQALAQYEYLVEIDGCLGYATDKAIKRFQRSKGLKPNGVVGKVLRRHLRLGEFNA